MTTDGRDAANPDSTLSVLERLAQQIDHHQRGDVVPVTGLSSVRRLALDTIILDPAFQVRFALDEANVQRLASGSKEDFDVVDPVEVYDTPEGLFLVHGFHRVEAAKRLGLTEIRCSVKTGSRDEGLIRACVANCKNGLPLRGEEKQVAARRLYKLVYLGGRGPHAKYRPGWSRELVAQEIGYSLRGLEDALRQKKSNHENVVREPDAEAETRELQFKTWKRMEKMLKDFPELREPIMREVIIRPIEAQEMMALRPDDRAALLPRLIEKPELDVRAEARKVKEARNKEEWEREREARDRELAAAMPAFLQHRYQLFHGDFVRVLQEHVADDSVDVIITDPSYAREYVPLYGQLAEMAARVLRPGGSLVVMTGQSHHYESAALMFPHLAYKWLCTYLTPGSQSPYVCDGDANTFFKPLLWLVKGKYDGSCIGDVFKSEANDKRFHRWGQSESGMARIVESFSRPGDVVLDPFLGGGTTGVCALALDRRFIGIDCDEKAITTTLARFALLVDDTVAVGAPQ